MTVTRLANGAVVDPCRLVSAAAAAAVLQADVGTPKLQQGGCIFSDAATGRTSALVVYALPAAQSAPFFQEYETEMQQFGVTFDPSQLNQDVSHGDMLAAINDLITITLAQTSFNAQKLDDVGDAAIWSWNEAQGFQEGTLLAARPGLMVGLVVANGASNLNNGDVQGALVPMAQRILASLPDRFSLPAPTATPTPPPGAAALDPCTLITSTDVANLLGQPASDGANDNGVCAFSDTATHSFIVRVYAFQSASAVSQTLGDRVTEILSDSPDSVPAIIAEVNAGQFTQALTDLVATDHSSPARILHAEPGLGDAAVFYLVTFSDHQAGVILALKGSTLAGADVVLKPGDSGQTETALVALLTGVMNKLPATFVVTGAP